MLMTLTKNAAWEARGLHWTLLATTALCAATPALAQAQGAEGASDDVQGGIQEIVVTARKRQESTQDIPVSVTSFSAEAIAAQDLSSLERVAAISPQFVIGRSPSGSGATLVLRGIGANTTSIGLEQSVAVVADGVYFGQGRIINEGLFDLGRIELLKGPQALFFGKNATAGVVNIVTADPGDKREFIAKAGYEFEGRSYFGEAVASGPLSDTLGIRVALRYADSSQGLFRNRGVPIVYTTTDRTTTAVPGVVTSQPAPAADEFMPITRDILGRVTLRWTPTDRTTVSLKASYADNLSNSPSGNAVMYRCPTGSHQFNAAIPCREQFVTYQNRFPQAIADSIPYGQEGGDLANKYYSWSITGTIEHEFENMTLTWVNNYNQNRNIFVFDADGAQSAISPTQVWATEWSKYRAFSSEVRMLTEFDGPLNAMVGAYYQDTFRDYQAWTASGGLENSATTPAFRRYLANSKDSQTNGETIAVFGQLIFKPIDQIEITAGVRYTDETKDSYFLQPYSHPIRVAQGIFLPSVTLEADQSWTDWSPEATITYQPSDDVTLYAAYKTAYKSGGFSNSGILSPTAGIDDFAFEPETAEGVEGGIKTLLAGRQLKVNLGAYWYKFSNLQLDFFRSDIFAFTTINAGSATTKGFELEYQFQPDAFEGFELHGSLNYNKARYGDSPGAPCYQGQTQSQGCNLRATNVFAPGNPVPIGVTIGPVPAGGNANRQNLRGLPTANAPLWTATMGFSFERDISQSMAVGVSFDGRFSDDYITSAFGNFYTEQESYVQLDASIRLKAADERWELALIGKNLSNEFYATGGVDAPNTGAGAGSFAGPWRLADQIGYIAPPRTIQVQATVRY